ncbi:MAG: hypothetical protein HY210_05945 [Candidatus Omnitrophica bacterium]|nr:hypothetical protein [Candidatus Omnitrophota bacterium]
MREIFGCGEAELDGLTIKDDVVSLNGIGKRKKDLCQEVVRRVDTNTVLPPELESKLLIKVANAIG